jgi:hypothetical protein
LLHARQVVFRQRHVYRGSTEYPNLPQRFRVNDTTTREGDETLGLFMSPSDKLKSSEKLYAAGVSDADVGYLGPAKLTKKALPDMRIEERDR